jgi:hypothetical protein
MKRLAFSAFCAFAIVAITAGNGFAQAGPPNLAGHWVVQQTGANGNSSSQVTLTQSGNRVVGTSTTTKNGFSGTFVNDTQINGTWNGPGGAGWLTVFVSPNGHSFNGTWGYNGRKANGSFVANKVLPPSPITAAGTWNVYGAGGETGFAGSMRCTQSGSAAQNRVAVVCHVGPVIINGSYKAADKVRATWTGPQGTGWFSFWFNQDNNSFNGIWGKGSEFSTPLGRVVGQRQLQ